MIGDKGCESVACVCYNCSKNRAVYGDHTNTEHTIKSTCEGCGNCNMADKRLKQCIDYDYEEGGMI
jgi:hypothetical protein